MANKILSILRYILSPQAMLFMLFVFFMFGKGLFNLMTMPEEKCVVLGVSLLFNVVVPTIIHKKIVTSRVLYIILMALSLGVSTYLISSHIFPTVLLAIYSTSIWLIGINLIFDIEFRIMAASSFLTAIYIMIYHQVYAFTAEFIVVLLLLGIYTSLAMKFTELRYRDALAALLLGVVSTATLFMFFQ